MARRNHPEDLRIAVAFLRSLRGWEQKDLAAAAGLSASSISRYESGEALPSGEVLESLALAVGLPLRMLRRLFTWIRAARAAVESAADPDDRDKAVEALVAEFSERASDLLSSSAALILAEFPDGDPGRRLGEAGGISAVGARPEGVKSG